MAVNKRAVMRREMREREKTRERAKKAVNGKEEFTKYLMEESFIQGREFGFETATAILIMALRDEFNFGNQRITRLLKRCSEESMKMDEMPTQVATDYIKGMFKRIRKETGVEIS